MDAKEKPSPEPERKPYVAPKLVRLGSVRDLTRNTAAGSQGDGRPFPPNRRKIM